MAANKLAMVPRNESNLTLATEVTMSTLMACNKRLREKDEMVNELYVRINVQEKWEEFLAPAPLAIGVLGSLMLLAADQDVSLAEQRPKKGFDKIRHPESFRSCLVQVSNDSYQSFLTAHDSMLKITDIVQEVPSRLKNIISLLMQPNNETISRHLPSHLNNFRADIDRCVQLAEAVEHRFAETILLIDEVVEAAVGTKGVIEEQEKQEERNLKRLKVQQEAQQAILEELDDLKKRAEEETEEALVKYRNAMDSMPGMGTMIGGMAAEAVKGCLETGVSTISTSFMSRNMIGAVAGGTLGAVLGQGDIGISMATAALGVGIARSTKFGQKSNINENSALIVEQQARNAAGLEHYQTAKDACQMLHEVTTFMTTSKTKKSADVLRDIINDANIKFESMKKKSESSKIREICKYGQKVSKKLGEKANELKLTPETEAKLEKRIGKLKACIAEREQRYRSRMGLTGTLPESPFATNAISKNGGNVPLSASIVETWRVRVEGERADWKQLREERNKVLEKHLDENKQMAELVGKIMSVNLSKVNMDDKIEYLKSGVIFLSEIKKHWTRLVLFFKKISVIISGPLNRAAKEFADAGAIEYDRQKSVAGYTMDGFVRDLVYQQALKAAGYSMAVNQFTSSYVAVSTDHIMPNLSSLNGILALDTKTEQMEAQKQLKADCDKASEGIKKYIENEKENFGTRISGRLSKIAQEFDTILPPLDENMRSAIENGTKLNALEYKPEPSLMERVSIQCDYNGIDVDSWGLNG